MNPSEAWALLTVRSVQLGLRSGSDHAALRTADIAALLAGLHREPFLMGMAAECGDMGALRQIELVLWVRARGMAERENWESPHGQFTVRRMAGVALYEAVADTCCYACNGTGRMAADNPGLIMAATYDAGSIRCPACLGSGQIRLSGQKKAHLAGINKDMWTRVWARRYERVFEIANHWRESARGYLASRVREVENDPVGKPPVSDVADDSGDGARKVMKINDYCAVGKKRASIGARRATPIENAPNFEALNRPTITAR